MDSTPPIPRPEEVARLSLRNSRSQVEAGRAASGAFRSDVERLKAERAADADDLAAMLVRVADADKRREVAERRATGLEDWTLQLEGKLAEARTRGDDIEAELVAVRRDLEAMRRENSGYRSKATVREMRVPLPPLPSPAAAPSADVLEGRIAMAKADAILEELEKQEIQAHALRLNVLGQTRRVLASERDTAPPPPKSSAAPVPPSSSSAGPRSKRTRRSIPAMRVDAKPDDEE
jgi:chromosome segregation ATPase